MLGLWHRERAFFVTRAIARPPSVPRELWTERQQREAREQNGGRCPPAWREGTLVSSRELQGLSSPWYFGAVPKEQAAPYLRSWSRLFASDGFASAWGPRTAERSDPCYAYPTTHECTWNGPSVRAPLALRLRARGTRLAVPRLSSALEREHPTGREPPHVPLLPHATRARRERGPSLASQWPFETAKVITAAIRVLREHADAARASGALDSDQLWALLKQYAHAHTHGHATNASAWELPGLGRAWIGEALHPDEGYWLVRRLLYANPKRSQQRNRGARYNHSTFCDLVLQFLGLRPRADGRLAVQPLLPPRSAVRWFAVDGVRARGRDVCVVYDRDGVRYGLGPGLHVLLEGIPVASGKLGDELVVEL